MNNSITQADQNDNQISKTIKRFFVRFHVASAWKASGAYHKKGTPATQIFQYLFLLIFSNRSMYMNLLSGRNTPSFAKDTVYRFMKSTNTNWTRFTTILASRIIRNAVVPLNNADRENVLCIDGSMFERNRSKRVELLARTYDHAKHAYKFGFRMLTLGWTDGSTFLPVNSILLSTDNKKNRVNEAVSFDKRSVGYKRRKLSIKGGRKVVITGFNGIGKLTLLKTLIGKIPSINGHYKFSDQVTIGYFEQDLLWDDTTRTPIQIISDSSPELVMKEVCKSLARCGISSKHAMQPIGTLSGGEQAKDTLKVALEEFPGTVLLVSHEEHFYREWTQKVINIEK